MKQTEPVAPLLTEMAVAQAVLDIAEEQGAHHVTARTLASWLNVSVGALYNYTGSMSDAIFAAEGIISAQLAEDLRDQDVGELATWIHRNPEHAALLFDPRRSHAQLSKAAGDVMLGGLDTQPRSAQPIEDMRLLMGMLLGDVAGRSHIASMKQWAPEMQRWYERSANRMAALTRPLPPPEPCTAALIAAAEAVIDEDPDLSDRERLARAHSIRLVMRNGSANWNFRLLSEVSGIPLAGLHQLGSRRQHLECATRDLVCATVRVAMERQPDSISVVADIPQLVAGNADALLGGLVEVLSPSLILEGFHRADREASLLADVTTRSDIPIEIVIASVVAVLVAGYLNREGCPEGWIEAPYLAAVMIRDITGS